MTFVGLRVCVPVGYAVAVYVVVLGMDDRGDRGIDRHRSVCSGQSARSSRALRCVFRSLGVLEIRKESVVAGQHQMVQI